MASPQYNHCQWYSLYVVQWDYGKASLKPVPLCKVNENFELLPTDPFPNYSGLSLHGRKLRVYTMPVSVLALKPIVERFGNP